MTLALKVLTWHLPQSLDPLLNLLPQTETSKRAARAILDLPAREQPDVIAFNGVTDRHALLDELGATYPHDTVKLVGPPATGPDEASGLMLFSRLPFLPLPTGGNSYYESFQRAHVPDLRGVGVVRVAGPFNPTTIAFTHAFRPDPPSNLVDAAAVRELELAFIRAVLLKVANGNHQDYGNSVVVGDLNVQGEPTETLSELSKVFAGEDGTFGGDFGDGWGMAMHAPNDLTGHDPGYTQGPTRLDYQCTHPKPITDIGLVPHHMSTPLRMQEDAAGFSGTAPRPEYSDPRGLLARLHRLSPHCSPSTAVELLKLPPENPTANGSKFWTLATELPDEDMYHWVYIDSAGTYSVFCNAALEVTAFRRSDLTHELAPVDVLSMSKLPPSVNPPPPKTKRFVRHFEDQGAIFAWREPFFLRFRGVSPAFSGHAPFKIIQHRGESPETAFVLQPHQLLNPELPRAQKLGTKDECFFRADRPDRFSKAPYEDDFVLTTPAGAGATLQLCDENLAALATEPSSAPGLELHRTGGAEKIFLILTRNDVNDVDFSITWLSALSYLTLETINLRLVDETSILEWGADELELSVNVDGENVYTNSWDDADSDEDWPNLAQDIRAAVQARAGEPVEWVALSDEVVFSVIKTDGAWAHGSSIGTLPALTPGGDDVVKLTDDIVITDPTGDGEMLLEGEMRRFPPY
jgi:hypothetical protein